MFLCRNRKSIKLMSNETRLHNNFSSNAIKDKYLTVFSTIFLLAITTDRDTYSMVLSKYSVLNKANILRDMTSR